MTLSMPEGDLPRNKPLMATDHKHVCLVVHPSAGVMERQRTVVVLGVERGGTSMVAGVLRALGVDMGRQAGLNHEDPRFLRDDETHLRHVIRTRNQDSDLWGFKMPKAVFHLDMLDTTLRNPYYVIVHRNLAAVADSWHQRGAGTYLDTIERALTYHVRLVAHCRKTKRPVVMVNYERAAKDPAIMVRELVSFLRLQPDEEHLHRALLMVTGDGRGYVNLPEHFFAVTPCQELPERAPLPTTDNTADVVDPDGWVTFDTLRVKQVYAPDPGPRLPANFWIRLTLDAPPDLDLATNPVRIYFDFIGEMFAGHCARPALKQGENSLFVETNGNAVALGVGPLAAGTRLRVKAELFHATEHEDIAALALMPTEQPGRKRRSLWNRLRRWLPR